MTKHCDDYIEDPSVPEVVRKYLEYARAPAHGALLPDPYPELYADFKGRRVRVVMASRFGDVGITENLKNDAGYQTRVYLSHLSNFSDKP